jgi:hypothetical protein
MMHSCRVTVRYRELRVECIGRVDIYFVMNVAGLGRTVEFQGLAEVVVVVAASALPKRWSSAHTAYQ